MKKSDPIGTIQRQGDIFFIKVADIPADAKKQKDGVIARGEWSGHMHRIESQKQAVLYSVVGAVYAQQLISAYIDAVKETRILHDTHHTTILDPGKWEVRRQRVYEPDGWKQVED